MFQRIFAVLAMIFAASELQASEYLVTANSASRDLSVIRLTDHKFMGAVKVSDEGGIDDVAATPDGKLLLAVVQIVDERNGFRASKGKIVAVDTSTGRKAWETPTDGNPHHFTVSADGREIYVPIYDRQYVLVLAAADGREIGRMFGLWGMHTTKLSADTKQLYAGSILTGLVHVFDLATRELVTSIAASKEFGPGGIRPFAVTKDGSTVYTQLSGFHGVAEIKKETGEIRYVRPGDLPDDFKYPVAYPWNIDHGLELSPDEKTLVAVSETTRKAYIYETPSLELIKTIPIGRIAKWVVFNRAGDRAYISNYGDNTVSVISMSTLTEVARVPSGGIGAARIKILEIPDERVAAMFGAK